MNLVCSIIFIITAVAVATFDYKYQRIPLWLVLINYTSLSLLIHPIFLIGIILILFSKKLNRPIDFIYLIIIGYLIIINNDVYSTLSIFILLVSIIFAKRDPMSFMIPIELVCAIEIIRRIL